MKKVFLIDDEIEVREGIRNCIDWTQANFEYCGDAPDGEVALPMIEQLNPDILITDIRMPFMDGLQLSRIVRQKMPHVKIIILSGHDEFEYAREALRINATEYCLKPISSSDLLEILLQVAMKIDQEKLEESQVNKLRYQITQNISLSKENLLSELCLGRIPATEAIEKAEEIKLEIISKCYFVFIIETENINESLFSRIEEVSPSLNFKRNMKETVFIFKGDVSTELEQKASQIKQITLSDIGSDSTFGIGGIKERLKGIALSFTEADEEKSYQSIISKYRQIGLAEPTRQMISAENLQRFDRNQLIYFFKYGEKTNINKFIQSYASCLKDSNLRASFFVYYFLIDVTITAAKFVEELDSNNEGAAVAESIYKLEKKISRIQEFEEIINYMEEVITLIIDLRNRTQNKFDFTIQKAKDYILNHHNEPEMSLNTVANFVNVSPSYFSNIFSQETGQTFVEFLTLTRINKAMELLKTTQDKTYEVAHKVGYSDPHYFCHLFKKISGMTTKDFRNQGKVTL